jgi:hypothetical protein
MSFSLMASSLEFISFYTRVEMEPASDYWRILIASKLSSGDLIMAGYLAMELCYFY